MIPLTDEGILTNLDAELALIGCLLSHNPLLERLAFLEADHFHSAQHQKIYRSVRRVYAEGKQANPLTLKGEFDADPDFNAVSGAKYLFLAVSAAVSVVSPVDLASHLVELAQRRALRAACDEVSALIQSDVTANPSEVALTLAKRFEDVSRGYGAPLFLDDFQVCERILEGLKDGRRPHPTGLPKLDQAMDGGFYPGKAYGFAARKKIGKTILASTVSHNLAEAGVKHLFVCGEMSPEEIHQRTLARVTDSFPSAFRSEYGQSLDFQRKIGDVAVRSKRLTLYYNAPGLTFDALRRVVVTAALQHGVKGFILDYWQLVGGKGSRQSTAEHLDEVAQWIADTCRKYGLFAMVMAQINQEGNTRGGEGMRLAFDQVYQINREDLTLPYAWLEMMETRYTAWMNIGSENQPGLFMNEKGPFFEQI